MEFLSNLSGVMQLSIVAGVVLVVALAAYLIHSRVAAQENQFGSAEEAFERDMMRQFGGGGASRGVMTPGMPPALPLAESPVPASAAHLRPPATSARTGEYDVLPELARSVAGRLSAGGIIESVEGPLRSRNPEIVGTILCLRGNRKVAVIESGWRTPDPDLEMMLSLLDGAIIAGPGEEPIFVRRLQNFIGDSIRL